MSARRRPTGPSPRSGTYWWLDESQCVDCGICADVCPEGALLLGRDDLFPTWQEHLCTACGRCADECPTAAIVVQQARLPQARPASSA